MLRILSSGVLGYDEMLSVSLVGLGDGSSEVSDAAAATAEAKKAMIHSFLAGAGGCE